MSSVKLLRRLSVASLVCLVLCISSTALSQNFTLSRTGTTTIISHDGQQFIYTTHITNLLNTTLTVQYKLEGIDGQNTGGFHMYRDSILHIPANSKQSVETIYDSKAGDTSRAMLWFTDEMSMPDTIYFLGIDTSAPPLWEIVTPWVTMGNYYQQPDSAVVAIVSNTDDTLTLEVSVKAPVQDGIVMRGSATRTLLPRATDSIWFDYDTTYLFAQNLYMVEGGDDTQHFMVSAFKNGPPPDTLAVPWMTDLGFVGMNDTICARIPISNPFDSAATITELRLVDTTVPGVYVSSWPTLPYTLEPGDTLWLDVCLITSENVQEVWAQFLLKYRFPGQNESQRSFYAVTIVNSCVAPNVVSVDFGRVLRGTTVTRQVGLQNYGDRTVLLTDVTFASDTAHRFSILDGLPLVFQPRSSTVIRVQFNAELLPRHHRANMTVHFDGDCRSYVIPIEGYVEDSVLVDSLAIPLFGNEERTLHFESDSTDHSKTYTFVNNRNDSLKIISVGLKSGTHFTITDIDPQLPEFTLAPEDEMQVTLDFSGTPGNYTDTLVIVTETGIIALAFPIKAQIHTADVSGRMEVAPPRLTVTPNPSSGPVQIELQQVLQGHIEVFDALGRIVTTNEGTAFEWERTALPSGTYYVRASGVGVNGIPFATTQRVVLE